jgi:hypothetical protein
MGHNATGRIKSLKNCSDSIGNRTRDIPVCSAVPQPIQWVPGLFPGCKEDISAEVKEIVEVYIHSPSRPSQPVLGRTLPLPSFRLIPIF